MQLTLMRWIDRYAGSVLCFLLTVIYKTFRTAGFFSKPGTRPKQGVLMIELSEMGSAILAYPLIAEIQNKYPSAPVYFLTFARNKDAVQILNVFPDGHILTIRDTGFGEFLIDTLKFIFRVRKLSVATTIDLELFSRFTAILTFLSGAEKRIGFYKFRMEGLYRGDFLTHKIPYSPQHHISKIFLSFLQNIDKDEHIQPTMSESAWAGNGPLPPKIVSSENAARNIMKKLKKLNQSFCEGSRLFIMNPSAGPLLPIRAWPIEHYIELSNDILKAPNHFIAIIGLDDAAGAARKIIEESIDKARCINLVNQTSLVELIDLFNVAEALITNDSGPAHFATLTSIKTFVFFGPETPVLYSPLGDNIHIQYAHFPCSPCLTGFNHRNSPCLDNRCLKAIKPGEVYQRIQKLCFKGA